MSGEPGNQARKRPALSPSRAADFKQCPLLYR
ncbi:MAG: recombinase RecB, partial [Mycobacterium sp.]